MANAKIDFDTGMRKHTYQSLLTSLDTTANTVLPYALYTEHTLYFGPKSMRLIKIIDPKMPLPHSMVAVGDKNYPAYPILTGLMAMPIYIIPLMLNKMPSFRYYDNVLKILLLGRITASFYTAISVALFYIILKKINELRNIKTNWFTYFFLFFYAFGTEAWVISSRTLWQHTSSLLFITIAILLLVKGQKNPGLIKWTGLVCGLAVVARPTNIVFAAVVAFYVFLNHRKEIFKFCLMAAGPAILMLTYNWMVFKSPFTNEYGAREDTSFSTPMWVGLVGYAISPTRSFLFITPPFLLSYFGMYKIIKKAWLRYGYKSKHTADPKTQMDYLDKILFFMALSYIGTLILFSNWWCWYGADRFGYGFFTEHIPYIAIFAYLIAAKFKKVGMIIFSILVVYSLYIQFTAVMFRRSQCSGDHNWSFYCLMPVKGIIAN